jgi:hypothetical protein
VFEIHKFKNQGTELCSELWKQFSKDTLKREIIKATIIGE